MPTINKLPKYIDRKPVEYTDHKLLRRKAYNSTVWRKLRETYIHEHPLCENCLKKGKVVPAVDIHHLKSPFDYANEKINQELLIDPNNLKALCKECHQAEHNANKNNRNPQEVLDALWDLLKDIPD